MARTEGSSRFRPRILSLALAAGAITFVAATSGTAQAAWDGAQDIFLGDSVTAEFATGAAGTEVHVLNFYAPDLTKISVQLKAAKGADLVPQFKLFDARTGAEVTTPYADGKLKNFQIPARGYYYFQIQASSGKGAYTLKTKGAYPKDLGAKGLATAATGDTSYQFGYFDGQALSATIKASKGSTAVATFIGFKGPKGAVSIDGIANGLTSMSSPAIPGTGTFTLTIRNTGTAGQAVDIGIKPKYPTGGTPWFLGAVALTRGTADDIRAAWLGSGHADLTAEAWRHWDADSPAVVPVSCAKCHSGDGYQDFLGANDGISNINDAPPGLGQGQNPNSAWPVGPTINCDGCHSAPATALTEVTFPSGKKITGLGDEARCMVCHQGRESKASIDAMLATAAPADADTPSAAIRFRNPHYFAAAASLYGRQAGVAYEYTGKAYERKFTHVESYNQCHECHNPHTLKLNLTGCATCHEIDPANLAADKYEEAVHDLHGARMAATLADFDGDAVKEGIYDELSGMSDLLYKAMQEYAVKVTTKPILYNGSAYPYWFEDKGTIGTYEPGVDTSFASWTARLVKAAFNYQLWQKDPGAFAHNGKYFAELIYDSVADLCVNPLMTVAPVDLARMTRNDSGHFDTSADAFTDWDATEAVSSSCVRCHSNEGFQFRLKYGIDSPVTQPPVSGMLCEGCHVTGATFLEGTVPALRAPLNNRVEFAYPTTATTTQKNSVTLSAGAGDNSYLCMTCHVGRQSQLTVDAAIAAASSTLNFTHVHYFPAGATQHARWVNVAYQYTGKTYAGRWNHTGGYDTSGTPSFSSNTWNRPMPASGQCTYCHMDEGSHAFEPEVSFCDNCHTFTDPADISTINRLANYNGNYDGDAATTTLKQEVDAIAAKLYARIVAYAPTEGQGPILMDPHASPYWYKDNGKLTNAETYTDLAEPYTDVNNNFKYDLGEPFTDTAASGNTNGVWDKANGVYDAGLETFTDANGNSAWDAATYDTNLAGDGIRQPTENDRYAFAKTPAKLLKAAYNYTHYQRDPGAWAHNSLYLIQVMIDSLEDIGGDLTGLNRPTQN